MDEQNNKKEFENVESTNMIKGIELYSINEINREEILKHIGKYEFIYDFFKEYPSLNREEKKQKIEEVLVRYLGKESIEEFLEVAVSPVFIFIIAMIGEDSYGDLDKKWQEFIDECAIRIIQHKPRLNLALCRWCRIDPEFKAFMKKCLTTLEWSIARAMRKTIEFQEEKNKKGVNDFFDDYTDMEILEFLDNYEDFDFNLYHDIYIKKARITDYEPTLRYIVNKCSKNKHLLTYIDKKTKRVKNKSDVDKLGKAIAIFTVIYDGVLPDGTEYSKKTRKEYNVKKEKYVISYLEKMEEICKQYKVNFITSYAVSGVISDISELERAEDSRFKKHLINSYIAYNSKRIFSDGISLQLINNRSSLGYMIEKYEMQLSDEMLNKIKNRERMTEEEKATFEEEYHNLKIRYGFLSPEYCKYVIYSTIMWNDFKKIRMAMLIDFCHEVAVSKGIKPITIRILPQSQADFYGTFGRSGSKSGNADIVLSEKLLKNFDKEHAEMLFTIYHEIEHAIQNIEVKLKHFNNMKVRKMYIEQVLNRVYYGYYKANYMSIIAEIEARRASFIQVRDLFKELEIDATQVIATGERGLCEFPDPKRVSVAEICETRIKECNELSKTADIKSISETKKVNIIEEFDRLWDTYKDRKVFNI